MFSLGGRFENCTECPAGSACPDPSGRPKACTGGNKLCLITKNYIAHKSLFSWRVSVLGTAAFIISTLSLI